MKRFRSQTCVRRFELPTPWSVAKCSIQLSYTHTLLASSNMDILLPRIENVNTFLKNRIKNLSGDKRRSPQLHLCRLCSSSPERRAVPGISRDRYRNRRSCWICQTGCSYPELILCRSFCSVNFCWCCYCFSKWYCVRWLNLCGCWCYCCNFLS